MRRLWVVLFRDNGVAVGFSFLGFSSCLYFFQDLGGHTTVGSKEPQTCCQRDVQHRGRCNYHPRACTTSFILDRATIWPAGLSGEKRKECGGGSRWRPCLPASPMDREAIKCRQCTDRWRNWLLQTVFLFLVEERLCSFRNMKKYIVRIYYIGIGLHVAKTVVYTKKRSFSHGIYILLGRKLQTEKDYRVKWLKC